MRLSIDPAEVAPRIPFSAIRREREQIDRALRARRILDAVLSRPVVERPPQIMPVEPEPDPEPIPVFVAPEPEPEPEDDGIPPRQMRRLIPILHAVADVTGLHRSDICGPRRAAALCTARFIFTLIARRHSCRSTLEIARAINRDHTTIIHAAKRGADLEATDPNFAALVAKATAIARKREVRHD